MWNSTHDIVPPRRFYSLCHEPATQANVSQTLINCVEKCNQQRSYQDGLLFHDNSTEKRSILICGICCYLRQKTGLLFPLQHYWPWSPCSLWSRSQCCDPWPHLPYSRPWSPIPRYDQLDDAVDLKGCFIFYLCLVSFWLFSFWKIFLSRLWFPAIGLKWRGHTFTSRLSSKGGKNRSIFVYFLHLSFREAFLPLQLQLIHACFKKDPTQKCMDGRIDGLLDSIQTKWGFSLPSLPEVDLQWEIQRKFFLEKWPT